MPQARELGIAKLLITGDPVMDPVTGRLVTNAGMGIVVGPRHVLTCAHVANTAARQPVDAAAGPGQKTSIMFPLSASARPVEGHLVAWHPMGAGTVGDIAVLELEAEVLADVGVARFARGAPDGHRLMVFGFGAGNEHGNYVEARFMGRTEAGRVQIDGTSVVGVFIREGYSGAAVWDTIQEAVVGMISAANVKPADRVAYMIPLAVLEQAWPRLVVAESTPGTEPALNAMKGPLGARIEHFIDCLQRFPGGFTPLNGVPQQVPALEPPTRDSLLELFKLLNPPSQLDRLLGLVGMKLANRPSRSLTHAERVDQVLDWAEGEPNGFAFLELRLKQLIVDQL